MGAVTTASLLYTHTCSSSPEYNRYDDAFRNEFFLIRRNNQTTNVILDNFRSTHSAARRLFAVFNWIDDAKVHFVTWFLFSISFFKQNGWDARGAAAAAASAVHLNEAGHHQESRHQTEDEGAAAAAVGIQLAGMTLPRRETAQFLLHPLYLLAYTLTLAATSRLTDTLSSSQSTFIVVSVVLLRSAGCVTLPSLPIVLRPAVTYLAGLLGILVAKFTETSLIQPDVVPMSSMIINSSSSLPNPQLPLQTGSSGGGSLSGSRRTSAVDHESRVMAARRRRTSSAALTSTQASAASSVATGQSGASSQGGCNTTGNNKVRRTSLPALLANKKDHLLVSVSPPLPNQLDSFCHQ